MRNRSSALSFLIGVGCGLGYIFILAQLFGRLLVPNPINHWLNQKLASTGHEVEYRIAVYAHDFLIYIIVAIPVALVLARLRPINSWKYLLVALGTSLIVQYWDLITDPSGLINLARHWHFYVGLGISVFALPLTFAAVIAVGKHRAPAAPDTVTRT
jgi:hypothetical protein